LQFLIQLVEWHHPTLDVFALVEMLLRLLIALLELHLNGDHLQQSVAGA
jgi:hypothetical protein